MGKIRKAIGSRISQSARISVSNVPYDAGLAIGAALLAVKHNTTHSGSPTKYPLHSCYEPTTSPYLGRTYSNFQIFASIKSLNPESFSFTSISNIDVYTRLSSGDVIGVFQGSSESGRRALGNRSLIADPRIADIRDLLNLKVKHRPVWRPFAPMILDYMIDEYFEDFEYSPYMSFALKFREGVTSKIPSVVHADGTGRLQSLTSEINPWMYSFLEGWYKFSGVPILINTSFNDNEPIVETPSDAIACFQRTLIDTLLFPEVDMRVDRLKDL
jgi:carbamoyltransferase